MNIADSYYRKTNRKSVYNITTVSNIRSIIEHGVLCFNSAKSIEHTSIALNSVQARRSKVVIPGGLQLHDYASLYFTYRNPMLYRIKDQAEGLCLLALSADVLDIKDCVVTDRNAATDLVRFYSAEEGIDKLDFDKIFLRYWTDVNPFVQNNLKAIKCAEILVPNQIPYTYVEKACVYSDESKCALQKAGFEHEIVVDPKRFFR